MPKFSLNPGRHILRPGLAMTDRRLPDCLSDLVVCLQSWAANRFLFVAMRGKPEHAAAAMLAFGKRGCHDLIGLRRCTEGLPLPCASPL